MFESLALEDPRNTTRNWTTALSFALQTIGIGLLILAPIGYTEAVSLRIDEPIVAPIGSVTNLNTQAHHKIHRRPRTAPAPTDGRFVYHPGTTNVHPDAPSAPEEPADYTGPIVPFATNVGQRASAIDNILSSMRRTPVVGSASSSTNKKPYPISHLDPGMLVKQVQPRYPHLAQIAGIQGTVLLAAVIDTQGRITNLRALSGHPILIPAAISAVEQWRYRPYILNGSPVEVETQISVVFTLQR
jgi:protein TonB